MTIHIAALGDSHFSEHRRFEECVRVHDWMANDFANREVDFVLCAGDVYEAKSTPLEREAVSSWLAKVANRAPVMLVRGNHDALYDIQIFSRLRVRYPITIEERAANHFLVNDETDARIIVSCLSWPRKADILAAGLDSKNAYQSIVNVLRGLGDREEPNRPRILLAHAMVNGAKTSTGQTLTGCDFEIALNDLLLAKTDIVVLGHIHKSQDWAVGDVPVVYTGSPLRQNYGETEEKSYTLIEIDEDKRVTWQRIPTPATRMLLLEGSWGLDEGKACWTRYPFPVDIEVKGAETRLRYEVDADRRAEAKTAAQIVRDRLLEAGAVDCKVEEVVKSVAKARIAAVASARTVDEKLVEYWRERGTLPAEARKAALLAKVHELENEIQQKD